MYTYIYIYVLWVPQLKLQSFTNVVLKIWRYVATSSFSRPLNLGPCFFSKYGLRQKGSGDTTWLQKTIQRLWSRSNPSVPSNNKGFHPKTPLHLVEA